MKNKKSVISKIIAVAILAVFVYACEKDDEDKPYVGNWESAVYDAYSLTGDVVKEKMVFNFTNDAFEDQIYQGTTAEALAISAGMKGSVTNPSEGTLQAEINEISLQGGPYTDKLTDETAFYQKFNTTLGLSLYEEFTATYSFSNDTMILSLPAKNPLGGDDITQRIRLTKK